MEILFRRGLSQSMAILIRNGLFLITRTLFLFSSPGQIADFFPAILLLFAPLSEQLPGIAVQETALHEEVLYRRHNVRLIAGQLARLGPTERDLFR